MGGDCLLIARVAFTFCTTAIWADPLPFPLSSKKKYFNILGDYSKLQALCS